jgi:putative drug exporter of the RND superfamily
MQSLARFTISHRRMVIAAWVFLLVVSLGTASTLKNRFSNNLTLPNTGTQRAADLLHSQFPTLAGDSDQIVFHSNNAPLSAPVVRARVAASLLAVKGLAHVAGVVSPYANPRAVSRDGTTGFATLTFDERGDALPQDAVKHVIRAAEAAGGGGLEIALGGYAIEESQRPTVGAATAIGIGAAMVVLFLSFGSLLAMGLPIVIALFGLGTSMGLIAALTHGLKTPDFASELALLIGLGVGVDYALFVVTRFRDTYLRNGGDVNEAVVTAMNTAGRSVAFAGATVVIAVLGLFVVGVQLFYGVALATSLTVLLMLAASLTLLPALLSLAGPRIGRKAAGRTRSGRAGGGWARWVAIIQRTVFERGWAAGILGVTRSPVEAFIPVIVFAIVFGLSMDYEVFLVSRIHEEWTHGSDHAAAIRNGVMRTGRVITAAAAVMVVVFASFAASDNHILKLFGLALATAVFLDAVVIRSILLPAVLALVGKRTWSFPRSLDRILPRLAIEPPQAEFAEVMPFPNPVPTEVS